jgi:hypothetical protein
MHDVIIVGARVAGAPTAMLLARRGLKVLVVDRAAFPSDTLSTHQVQLPGVARLARWGVLDAVLAGHPPAVHAEHGLHAVQAIDDFAQRGRVGGGRIRRDGADPPARVLAGPPPRQRHRDTKIGRNRTACCPPAIICVNARNVTGVGATHFAYSDKRQPHAGTPESGFRRRGRFRFAGADDVRAPDSPWNGRVRGRGKGSARRRHWS